MRENSCVEQEILAALQLLERRQDVSLARLDDVIGRLDRLVSDANQIPLATVSQRSWPT